MPRKRLARRGRTGTGSSSTAPQGTLVFTPDVMSVSATAGEAAFEHDTVLTLSNTGSGMWAGPQISDNAAWLTLALSTGANGVLTLTPTINPSALSAGNYSATITATDANVTNSGLTATINLAVAAEAPRIALAPETLDLTVTAGGASAQQSVIISNVGGSTLTAPTVGTVTYTGAFTGWVNTPAIASNGDGTYTLTFIADCAGGSAGSYSADVQVVSSGASNTPMVLVVNLTVSAAQTALLVLDRSLDDTRGLAKTVGFRSGNSIPLAGPSISATSYTGSFSNWATTTLGATSLTVTPDLTGLPDGTGFFHTDLVDANSATGARYTVVLVVNTPSPSPTLSVSPSALAPVVTVGSSPGNSEITITNVSGSFPALGTITATFVSPVSWASLTLASDLITVAYSAGSLSAGTYSATVRVTASLASNSPVDVPIFLTVQAASGAFDPPRFTLPTWATFDTNDDGIDNEPMTLPALNTFS